MMTTVATHGTPAPVPMVLPSGELGFPHANNIAFVGAETFVVSEYPKDMAQYWKAIVDGGIQIGIQLDTTRLKYNLDVVGAKRVLPCGELCLKSKTLIAPTVIQREYELKTSPTCTHKFTHFSIEWPNRKLPNVSDFSTMMAAYKKTITEAVEAQALADSPSVEMKTHVHCMFGRGRSGTFIYARLLEILGATPSPEKILSDMRTQRKGMVETLDQVMFAMAYAAASGISLPPLGGLSGTLLSGHTPVFGGLHQGQPVLTPTVGDHKATFLPSQALPFSTPAPVTTAPVVHASPYTMSSMDAYRPIIDVYNSATFSPTAPFGEFTTPVSLPVSIVGMREEFFLTTYPTGPRETYWHAILAQGMQGCIQLAALKEYDYHLLPGEELIIDGHCIKLVNFSRCEATLERTYEIADISAGVARLFFHIACLPTQEDVECGALYHMKRHMEHYERFLSAAKTKKTPKVLIHGFETDERALAFLFIRGVRATYTDHTPSASELLATLSGQRVSFSSFSTLQATLIERAGKLKGPCHNHKLTPPVAVVAVDVGSEEEVGAMAVIDEGGGDAVGTK